MSHFIKPNWPAPQNVQAYCTTKTSGNLADHVGDNPKTVANNRQQLIHELNLPQAPHWLTQVHGTTVVNAHETKPDTAADASYSTVKNEVCAVLTADCLPILFCNQQGSQVAATHAGWRGLKDGVLENTLATFSSPSDEIFAYLGPAISNKKFEVRQDVYDVFIKQNRDYAAAFTQINDSQWLADIYLLAKMRLQALGVIHLFGGEHCTYSDEQQFYSFRRDGLKSGRQLSLIWLA